jgi:hypothetical protein
MNKKVYIAGSMEGRIYDELFYEHYYVRSQLVSLGLEVFDPLLKEKHNPGKTVGLKTCGMNPYRVYKQDLGAVESSDIIFWVTGDKATEGSITEMAWAGCMNRFKEGKKKIIIVVSPLRWAKKINHFANMHDGVKLVRCVDDGISYLRKTLKRFKK